SLIAEKQIAVNFAKKELAGNRYIADLRTIYAAILAGQWKQPSTPEPVAIEEQLLRLLSTVEAGNSGILETGELERTLAAAIRDLWSRSAGGANADGLALEALTKSRRLISRIGDDSNLTLDPDLDSYYLQDIVVTKLPTWLGQLAELRALSKQSLSGS